MQVKLPSGLARDLHITAGDEFFWRRSDSDPAVLTFLPSEVVERRYVAGEALEASTRSTGRALPDSRPGESRHGGPTEEGEQAHPT